MRCSCAVAVLPHHVLDNVMLLFIRICHLLVNKGLGLLSGIEVHLLLEDILNDYFDQGRLIASIRQTFLPL
eukprot:SAG31_NODE_45503_length_258_cov_1.113208_1_plen_70_part_01